jgi:hypothetical protein
MKMIIRARTTILFHISLCVDVTLQGVASHCHEARVTFLAGQYVPRQRRFEPLRLGGQAMKCKIGETRRMFLRSIRKR